MRDHKIIDIDPVLLEIFDDYGRSTSISFYEEPPCLVTKFIVIFSILQVNAIVILWVRILFPPLQYEWLHVLIVDLTRKWLVPISEEILPVVNPDSIYCVESCYLPFIDIRMFVSLLLKFIEEVFLSYSPLINAHFWKLVVDMDFLWLKHESFEHCPTWIRDSPPIRCSTTVYLKLFFWLISLIQSFRFKSRHTQDCYGWVTRIPFIINLQLLEWIVFVMGVFGVIAFIRQTLHLAVWNDSLNLVSFLMVHALIGALAHGAAVSFDLSGCSLVILLGGDTDIFLQVISIQ